MKTHPTRADAICECGCAVVAAASTGPPAQARVRRETRPGSRLQMTSKRTPPETREKRQACNSSTDGDTHAVLTRAPNRAACAERARLENGGDAGIGSLEVTAV
eukprot:6201810-Pleurochrysis_carterae.AAC.1